MADGAHPAVFTIPTHKSFADALAAGLRARFGDDPMALAGGRILLPNGRATRAVTEAFVRASDGGLVLPRLVVIGDPELDERIGGALDPALLDAPVPPAIDPLERQLALAAMIRRPGESSVEAMRLAADLARTLDALSVEEIDPARLRAVASDRGDLARHWQVSMDRLDAIVARWPAALAARGLVDLAERRNRLLRRTAERWADKPPAGFTVAAGISTAAPAIAALMRRVALMDEGMVVLPGLALADTLPDEEWDVLDGEPSHPQHHLKLLLDRMGVARGEVRRWPGRSRASSPAVRMRSVANAMTAAEFSDKWSRLPPRERRLTGIRAAELPDPASEAMAIAIALRGALEKEGETAALVTPDRQLAARVAALLERWGIEADDSAGRPLSQEPAGTLLLGIAAAAAERLAPVSLLALLKHPLVASGEGRSAWLRHVRRLDRKLRGPRPGVGLAALDTHFEAEQAGADWAAVRPLLEPVEAMGQAPLSLAAFAAALREAASALAGPGAWRNADGRAAAELVARLEASEAATGLVAGDEEWVALLRGLMDSVPVRPPYGGHPRIFIWGLLEARLQHADFMVLGGLNEGVWPSLPSPDPWLAPRVRADLGLPGLDLRIGLSAHDFASALGAPRVLVTRARRDGKAPTVASRFWLRLQAMTGGVVRDRQVEDWAWTIDDPGTPEPVGRPAPAPPVADRPRRISVTDVDRLNADPFAFYAKAMLGLRPLNPVDADQSAAWKGDAVHKVLQSWLEDDDCDPATLVGRARALIAGEAIHPMLRALWQPRLMEAIEWVAAQEQANRAAGRVPLAAERSGKAVIGGVSLEGRADRIDRLGDGGLGDGGLAIVDYKTGQPPKPKAVEEGFALQLGLLGLIASKGGFEGVSGIPGAHEYWSLAKKRDQFGFVQSPDEKEGSAPFLERTLAQFLDAAGRWLTGDAPFTAKLNPAYAPYEDYDQLMRLEEWYGRD